MTKKVVEILEELESLEGGGSAGAKKALLVANKDNDVLRRVFTLTYDPYIVFYVKKVKVPPPIERSAGSSILSDDVMFNFMENLEHELSTRKVTGNLANECVVAMLRSMTALEQKWAMRILLRNLRCGVNEGTVNKVWPDAIQPFACQLAVRIKSKFVKGEGIKILEPVSYPLSTEPKLDGLRLLAVKTTDVTLYTRNGTVIDSLPTLKAFLQRNMSDNTVLDGESLGKDWNESSSVMMSSKNAKDDSNMIFHVFDCLTLEEWRSKTCAATYIERRRRVIDEISAMNAKEANGPVKWVDSLVVSTEKELLEYFAKCMDEGFEGIMLKALDSTYQWDRTRDVLKLKPFVTYEGVVVGHFLGRPGTKREGLFAGFFVLLPNGVITRVGSGMKDTFKAQVQLEGPEMYVGKIAECKAQPDPMTTDGLTVDGRMRFPSFVRFREKDDVDPKVYEAWVAYKLSKSVGAPVEA